MLARGELSWDNVRQLHMFTFLQLPATSVQSLPNLSFHKSQRQAVNAPRVISAEGMSRCAGERGSTLEKKVRACRSYIQSVPL